MDGNAITPPDRSRVAQVVIWFLLLTAVSGVVARLSTKWAMSRKLFVDDMLIIAAQVSRENSGVHILMRRILNQMHHARYLISRRQ